ncbi:hypothetical protein [Halorussus aquaticus]|uniref:Uncharacterized protein n=1 Tax=Halorussus aquaticus TaxID=2953748 RepID=A0ABD5PYH1_9EURY|nr:hypothetical protein [Halorussus aquaticus]
MNFGNSRFASAFIAVLLVASSITGAAGVALAQEADVPSPIDDPTELNYDASTVHNPKIPVTVSKDVHHIGDWTPTQYESDSGEARTLNASLNQSKANPIALVATDINASDFGEFPRKNEGENTASALDASEWATDSSGIATTGATFSVEDATTAPGVNAVRVNTSSLSSGDTGIATYSNFSITSDEAKRFAQFGVDINTLDSGTHAEVRVVDEDGDYKAFVIDPNNATADADVIANSTGDGYVTQQQMGGITTEGTGDGTFNNIQSVEVRVTDGDLDASFSLINAEKMGQYTFGEQAYDEDGDGEKDETRTLYEPNGQYRITSYESLQSSFSGAEVHNTEQSLQFHASNLTQEMDAQVEFSSAGDFPDFELIADVYYRLQLPSAYDLSYQNAELTDTVDLPSGRYQSVEVAEGVGDTGFQNISSWTSVKSKYGTQGADVTLDSTIQPGQQIAIHYQYPITSAEQGDMTSQGGVAGQFRKGGGGNWASGIPILGTLVSIVGAIFGGKWLMNR